MTHQKNRVFLSRNSKSQEGMEIPFKSQKEITANKDYYI
jgi:hypothetical protein